MGVFWKVLTIIRIARIRKRLEADIAEVLEAERPDMTPEQRHERAQEVVRPFARGRHPVAPFKTLAVWAMLEGDFEWDAATGALNRVSGRPSSNERFHAISAWMARQES